MGSVMKTSLYLFLVLGIVFTTVFSPQNEVNNCIRDVKREFNEENTPLENIIPKQLFIYAFKNLTHKWFDEQNPKNDMARVYYGELILNIELPTNYEQQYTPEQFCNTKPVTAHICKKVLLKFLYLGDLKKLSKDELKNVERDIYKMDVLRAIVTVYRYRNINDLDRQTDHSYAIKFVDHLQLVIENMDGKLFSKIEDFCKKILNG